MTHDMTEGIVQARTAASKAQQSAETASKAGRCAVMQVSNMVLLKASAPAATNKAFLLKRLHIAKVGA